MRCYKSLLKGLHGRAKKKSIKERPLSKSELDRREDIVLDLKSAKKDFVKRYGKDAEAVMYATATKRAKKQMQEERNAKIKGMLKDYLGWGGLEPDLQNYKGLTKD